jgi:hypothetical protein
LSAQQLANILKKNIKKLDQLHMNDEKLRALLTGILQLTIPVKIESNGSEDSKGRLKYGFLLSPYELKKMPDSVFVKFDFNNLSKRELLSIFHPYKLKSLRTLGCKVVNGSLSMIFVDHRDGIVTVEMSRGYYENRSKKQENYNIHRLGLLTKDLYLGMRDRAHREIVKIGDEIFSVSKTKRRRRRRHKKQTTNNLVRLHKN